MGWKESTESGLEVEEGSKKPGARKSPPRTTERRKTNVYVNETLEKHKPWPKVSV